MDEKEHNRVCDMTARGFLIESLLHRYNAEHAEVISSFYLLTLLTNYKSFSPQNLMFPNKFLFFPWLWCQDFRNYSSNNIYKVYKAPNQNIAKKNKQVTCS